MQFDFERLEVYQEAVEIVHRIYGTTKLFPRDELFGITNQLRRASTSIPSNIAEGSSRGKKEFIHFLNIARGSCYECVPLLEISRRQGYIKQDLLNSFIQELHKILKNKEQTIKKQEELIRSMSERLDRLENLFFSESVSKSNTSDEPKL